MRGMDIKRRDFLKAATAASGLFLTSELLARSAHAQPSEPGSAAPGVAATERKTRHVVLIAFAGGVRSRETFGHFGAARSIFTGIAEQHGIRENARSNDVTLFEYLRKDLGWGPNEAWIATSGGAQQVNYAYGLNPDYGARFGANTLDGEGIFNREFKALLQTWGRPRE